MRHLSQILALISLVCCLCSVSYGSVDFKKDIPWEELSDRNVSEDWGKATIQLLPPGDWKHGETEHFVIHYSKDPSKLARRLERIYAIIFEFFGNPEDRMGDRKSHIYAIHEWPKWEAFKYQVAKIPWMAGVCRGHEFWFPSRDRNGDFDLKSRTLNHEMTHLVFNRIYPRHVPTWLNEGIAEYFGSKETMSRRDFRKIMGRSPRLPLDQFLAVERGITTNEETFIHAFYSEAAILVDFLTAKHDHSKLKRLVEESIHGKDPRILLPTIYEYNSFTEFEIDYLDYREKFE
ncbi:MAG: hypothetical protein AAF558_06915 [Verrucomicrobiota bacterium]